ncbi:N-acetylmuramoyl-L-alanine amidase [Mesorhizobium sp. M0915]|uniref:N-acetylmuramoyl-L-alanine amidase n=1 Tax=Mesorhizobium sp. M0915 TaxID=2957027 RepID=UPI003337B4F0
MTANQIVLALSVFIWMFTAGCVCANHIISRSEWGAHSPVLVMKSQVPIRITVHHTGTLTKPSVSIFKKMRSLQEFSQSRSKLSNGKIKPVWSDVPYHFYVSVDGSIAAGRDTLFVGDTNTDYDPSGHISIAVEGNFETETPSVAEISSLKYLIEFLVEKYDLNPNLIGVHSDFAHTACPGKNLVEEVRRIADGIE